MEAVRRLTDVGILTVFILSIFALTGLQIYQGTLTQKCIRSIPEDWSELPADKSPVLDFISNKCMPLL